VTAMWARVVPGRSVGGEVRVPGDKSIAHRWLLAAATGRGNSRLEGMPPSLDVAATAACLGSLLPALRPELEAWTPSLQSTGERNGSTWNDGASTLDLAPLDLRGEGRDSLQDPGSDLDCGNSGTTMRLVAGLLASSPFTSVLTGDASLRSRPMERVARPLRAMGADVRTTEGHAPLEVSGGPLRGVRWEPEVPSAQVKGAILLAGAAAEGTTTVVEVAPTRDHTERLLRELGAPIASRGAEIAIEGPFQHAGFRGSVPGDPSSAAFLLCAAAATSGSVRIGDVCVNPTRLRFLDVLGRMGLEVEVEVERDEVGEPVGSIALAGEGALRPVDVPADELPLLVDEVPTLAVLAAFAGGPSRFRGAAELRVKESDRLAALRHGITALGGRADVEGDDLVVHGGGLEGGTSPPTDDHRVAMALTIGALGARSPSRIAGIASASVSFPGFVPLLRSMGAELEVEG